MSSLDATHYLLDVSLKSDKVPSLEEYPFNLPVVKHLGRLVLHPAITFIVGENGSGKSTLLEAIAVAWGFNAEGARGISTSKPGLLIQSFPTTCALVVV